MRNAPRILLALLVAVLLLGQDQCATPDYTQPGESGESPKFGERPPWPIWRYTHGPNQPATDCDPRYYTFEVMKHGLICNASFDFQPLVRQVVAQANAVVETRKCKPGCANRVRWNYALITDCPREGLDARVRLETGLLCSALPVEKPEEIEIPAVGPIGPFREQADFKAWTAHHTHSERFDNWPVVCDDRVELEYVENADCDQPIAYGPMVERAFFEATRRFSLIRCAEGCERRHQPEWTYHTWGCSPENGGAFVRIQFRPCQRKAG